MLPHLIMHLFLLDLLLSQVQISTLLRLVLMLTAQLGKVLEQSFLEVLALADSSDGFRATHAVLVELLLRYIFQLHHFNNVVDFALDLGVLHFVLCLHQLLQIYV